jgi:hypothetical protein
MNKGACSVRLNAGFRGLFSPACASKVAKIWTRLLEVIQIVELTLPAVGTIKIIGLQRVRL